MPFDVDLHCNTFKFRFWAVYTQAYGGTDAIAPEYAAANRGHHRIFFFGPRKRGVRPHPPNPPWLRAWMRQGFKYDLLCRKFKQFYRSHFDLISRYSKSVTQHLREGVDSQV